MAVELTVHFIVHGDYTHIFEALRSLRETTTTPHRVVVTINTGQITVVNSGCISCASGINDNQGCCQPNAVLRNADTPFVALLNDDITLHDGAVDTLVRYLKEHDNVALVGPALQNADGTPQVSAYSDPSLLRTLYKISGLATLTHQQSTIRAWLWRTGVLRLTSTESLKMGAGTRAVPVIKGAVMVVRRIACEKAGVIDEFTKAYGEEYGWNLRLRQEGWQLVLVTEARVTHYGVGQARLRLGGWLLVEDRKASLAYYLQYRPRRQALVVRLEIIIFHSLYTLGWFPFSRQRAADHWRVARMATTYRLSRV
jgi:GT2 family glycosyltransferase